MMGHDLQTQLLANFMIFSMLAITGMALMVMAAIINGIKIAWERCLMRITNLFSGLWSLLLVLVLVVWLIVTLLDNS
jgi:ABC-type dipeptide/oligopeptide/nickel transport system permease subunit